MITTPNDYTGFYQIAGNSFSDDELETYIVEQQRERLIDLLGINLYNLFIADLDENNEPQTTRFQEIFNPIAVDVNGVQTRSKGIPTMLKGFTYYNFVKDSDFVNTITGNVKNDFSNSKTAMAVQYGLYQRYNTAVMTFEAIQQYICDNSETYPEFNGITIEFITWLD